MSVSAAVLCFEALRQRRQSSESGRNLPGDGRRSPYDAGDGERVVNRRAGGREPGGCPMTDSARRRRPGRGRPGRRLPPPAPPRRSARLPPRSPARSRRWPRHRGPSAPSPPEDRKSLGQQLHEARADHRGVDRATADGDRLRRVGPRNGRQPDRPHRVRRPPRCRPAPCRATSTWSHRPVTSSRTSSWAWDSKWPKGPRSKPTGSTSAPSTSHRPIRPAACGTPSISTWVLRRPRC